MRRIGIMPSDDRFRPKAVRCWGCGARASYRLTLRYMVGHRWTLWMVLGELMFCHPCMERGCAEAERKYGNH